jgi:hypothetical protein
MSLFLKVELLFIETIFNKKNIRQLLKLKYLSKF